MKLFKNLQHSAHLVRFSQGVTERDPFYSLLFHIDFVNISSRFSRESPFVSNRKRKTTSKVIISMTMNTRNVLETLIELVKLKKVSDMILGGFP